MINRNRRAQALDSIDSGLINLTQKLASIGTERFHIAPLPFCKDGVKSQRRLARPRNSGEDDQAISGQFQINVFEIVLPSSSNTDHVVPEVEGTLPLVTSVVGLSRASTQRAIAAVRKNT